MTPLMKRRGWHPSGADTLKPPIWKRGRYHWRAWPLAVSG